MDRARQEVAFIRLAAAGAVNPDGDQQQETEADDDLVEQSNVESRHGLARSLRGRNDRSEKVGNRGQIFSIWRCIVVLFAEKSRKYGPILPLSQ